MKKRVSVRVRLDIDELFALIEYHDKLVQVTKTVEAAKVWNKRHQDRIKHFSNIVDEAWPK